MASPDDRRQELWTLYRAAVDMMNFQITLNWDRAKFYFLFNAALLTVAGGLGRFGAERWAEGAIFVLAALNSFFAAHAIRRGHEYYRAARAQLKHVERELGLAADDAAKTTPGMVRESEGRATRSLGERLTITNASIVLQLAIGIAAVAALVRLATD